jgi:3-hydroxyisobutyrate dehydrogenase-like beta-hydroxyacid dehydrogenase
MGSSIGAALVGAGHLVKWVSDGRGSATRNRAQAANLIEETSFAAALHDAQVVVSVCPPAAAGDVATSVGRSGFRGVYLDANAVSPSTARRIGENLSTCGITFVDGGIVGPPAEAAGTTRLYLSGPAAPEVASLFENTVVDARRVDDQAGSASAVKVCFAAWTKGTTALLLAIRALADAEGVTTDLLDEWATSIPELVERSERVARSGLKAWRFAPEMEEIAATFASAGLPDGFHEAAADIYWRMAAFKDAEAAPTLGEVIESLKPDPEAPRRTPPPV